MPAPPDGRTLILGHGAGAGQRSAFMVDFAHALSALGVDVVTFNFLYTEQGRQDSGSRAGARGLLSRGDRGGARQRRHARGARCSSAASRWAAGSRRRWPPPIRSCAVAGLVLLGYPLHPPGRPTERRDKHLPAIARPMLFVQGTRDAFGTPDELAPILGDAAAARRRARRRAGRSFVQAVEEGSRGAGRGLRRTCSARSWTSSDLQLHDVAAVREAVARGRASRCGLTARARRDRSRSARRQASAASSSRVPIPPRADGLT